MMRRVFAGAFLALVGVLMVPRAHAAGGVTRGDALAQCNASITALPPKNPPAQCFDDPNPPPASSGRWLRKYYESYYTKSWIVDDRASYSYAYSLPDPPDYYCQAGLLVPPGTDVNYDAASGSMCTIGQHSCSLALNVGGDHNGSYTQTGEACGGTPAGEPKTIPEPPEPDPLPGGGHQACDEISGTCVTVKPPDPGPPAPPSSSTGPNDTTTTTGHTTTPGGSTTTITNTTTTTTGGGTGGDGTGTGPATSSSSTAVTQHPASASTSSSKCTGGACDVGNADGVMGAMYRPSTDTPAGIYNGFSAQVAQSPLITAASGFFTMNASGGTCPVWHIPGNKYWGPSGFDFTFFCSAAMLQLLALAGYLVLAVGAFNAFRIALY